MICCHDAFHTVTFFGLFTSRKLCSRTINILGFFMSANTCQADHLNTRRSRCSRLQQGCERYKTWAPQSQKLFPKSHSDSFDKNYDNFHHSNAIHNPTFCRTLFDEIVFEWSNILANIYDGNKVVFDCFIACIQA